ncbi:MAG: hypothetical protein ACK5LF_13515 [Bacteroides xylanisolvens]
MVERLNQISLNDFIEVSCGNYCSLLLPNETSSKEELKERASKLIVDYRNIVNPSGMKAMIMDKEDLIKERAKLLSLRICKTLLSIDCYKDVCDILKSFDIDALSMTDEQIASKVDFMLHTAIFEYRRNTERRNVENVSNKSTPEQIRSSFDTEIAFLMTFFKMNIDSRVINAAIYANIVHQAEIEIANKKRST